MCVCVSLCTQWHILLHKILEIAEVYKPIKLWNEIMIVLGGYTKVSGDTEFQ